MARRKKIEPDDLLVAMRRAILAVLNDPQADVHDRKTAIEAGTRILAIEYKMGSKKSGGFFSGSEG